MYPHIPLSPLSISCIPMLYVVHTVYNSTYRVENGPGSSDTAPSSVAKWNTSSLLHPFLVFTFNFNLSVPSVFIYTYLKSFYYSYVIVCIVPCVYVQLDLFVGVVIVSEDVLVKRKTAYFFYGMFFVQLQNQCIQVFNHVTIFTNKIGFKIRRRVVYLLTSH